MAKVEIRGNIFLVNDDIRFWSVIDQWEPYSFDILDRFLNKDNVFVDVGAWNGVLSMYASRICKGVYSFEPDPTAFRKLEHNISLNDMDNVKIHNYGCSSVKYKHNFYVRVPGDSTSSLIYRDMPGYENDEIYLVDMIRLSEFLADKDNIGLVKMDIEGGEIFVIKEMAKYIQENKPPMYISFHPNWFPDKDKNIKGIADVLGCYDHIYDRNFERVTIDMMVDGLNGTMHNYIFYGNDNIQG